MQKLISLIGLDIAKSVFQVHAADEAGHPVLRKKLKRDEVAAFFRALALAIVGIEAVNVHRTWPPRQNPESL